MYIYFVADLVEEQIALRDRRSIYSRGWVHSCKVECRSVRLALSDRRSIYSRGWVHSRNVECSSFLFVAVGIEV
jgi:hypothetical protein